MASEHGPFSSERQAMSTPAGARIRAAYDARPGMGASIPARVLVMTDACAECGVDIGALDLATLKGIAWREAFEAVVTAGLIVRAYEAGRAAGRDGTVTEWALAYTHRPNLPGMPHRRVIQPYPDEAMAREAVAEILRMEPGDEPALMRREVGPWKPAPEEEARGD